MNGQFETKLNALSEDPAKSTCASCAAIRAGGSLQNCGYTQAILHRQPLSSSQGVETHGARMGGRRVFSERSRSWKSSVQIGHLCRWAASQKIQLAKSWLQTALYRELDCGQYATSAWLPIGLTPSGQSLLLHVPDCKLFLRFCFHFLIVTFCVERILQGEQRGDIDGQSAEVRPMVTLMRF